jgi:hypothetical protein
MAKYKLPDGNEIEIDEADVALVRKFNWKIAPNGYVYTTMYLHRLLATTDRTKQVDRNKLNNRRSNLREVTQAQNCRNKRLKTWSQHTGITRHGVGQRRKKWRAYIYRNKKQVSLGTYSTELEAATAYNEAALALYGKDAVLNVVKT